MTETSLALADRAREFADSMGMMFCHVQRLSGGGLLLSYDWPRSASGLRWDHLVYFLVFVDGSYTVLVNTPRLGLEDTKRDIHTMVEAVERMIHDR